MRSFVLIGSLCAVLMAAGEAHAQTITYRNNRGQAVSSWRDGDVITVDVRGGSSAARFVEIYRQTGSAGAAPFPIYQAPYNPARGLSYTFVAAYPGYVSITTRVKTNPYSSGWTALRTLWKNQR